MSISPLLCMGIVERLSVILPLITVMFSACNVQCDETLPSYSIENATLSTPDVIQMLKPMIVDGRFFIPSYLQVYLVNSSEQECRQKLISNYQFNTQEDEGPAQCPGQWDGLACWPDTQAGHLASQPCPSYIHKFRVTGNATKQCGPDGQWFFHPMYNKTWTNYSQCTEPTVSISPFLKKHVSYIQVISNIGYSVTLISMILALIIILSFKKLRCTRNILHANLFLSFICRASMALLRDFLMPGGLALTKDIRLLPTGKSAFNEDIPHWECRLLMTLFNYAMMANYSWIFIEALYLHTLLFLAVFSESSGVTYYIVTGWVCPAVFVLIWVILRATLENIFCWNTHPTAWVAWVIKGPVLVTIILNFIFFINIIRILFAKLLAFSTPDSSRYRHSKLARSGLILIPLFGIPYIVFLGAVSEKIDETTEIIKLYFEMTFNSFNGFLVSLLYCFLNGEVRGEISKKWERYRMNRYMPANRTSGGSNAYSSRPGRNSFRTVNTTLMDKDEQYSGTSSSPCPQTRGQQSSDKLQQDDHLNESSGNEDFGQTDPHAGQTNHLLCESEVIVMKRLDR